VDAIVVGVLRVLRTRGLSGSGIYGFLVVQVKVLRAENEATQQVLRHFNATQSRADAFDLSLPPFCLLLLSTLPLTAYPFCCPLPSLLLFPCHFAVCPCNLLLLRPSPFAIYSYCLPSNVLVPMVSTYAYILGTHTYAHTHTHTHTHTHSHTTEH
jgi:hypothetical protein